MGSIIGGLIGGVGSLVGGLTSSGSDGAASKQALTGYNYLAGNQANQTAQSAGITATNGATSTQNTENQLLTGDQSSPAFANYLDSTGYNFQKQQGEAALTGSAAARGILNSGATAKALTSYGQNLASTGFNNYLGNLSNLNTQQQNTSNTGVNAAGAVGIAGTAGGGNASSATQAGGANLANGITSAAGSIGGQSSNILNYFGGV